MKSQYYLILIVGPTAVGKTELCINLAKKYQTEILSCDSRQFYREMNLGTAKPTSEELKSVPHHFINSRSIEEDYDVKQFEQDAITLLEQLFAKKNVVIMTGGSGLFADAVVNGLDEMPTIDSRIREQVIKDYQEKGIAFLQSEVQKMDPDYFEMVDQLNPQRLMRALEVIRGTGKPFSSFRIKKKADRPFKVIKIGLERPRPELYERIERRMDQMIQAGLFDEADALFGKRHLNSLQTLGYTEIFDFLEGKYDRAEAIRLLKRNSRRYAKRQLTWFKKDPDIKWFNPENQIDIFNFISDQIS
ncbi:MAG: tRNA (adenosine(37)-N6)-dimethylallyltransferase MiaA [Algoriphagus sp.]|uniref:tRNA (adenosine(37)-N6)-dimethylallyltransferase MiaA n=1 Tax=Algoriphagus sp. TaxID=1872435 RepID=UPI002613D661|nr:tRNA (adenosine(37)-N6)-dimethylallyltransferase MiaA [Algoriphagus sp.]MDG1277376.1 tRNA (adenosine(37)-N6)-dimethylallyltransferase MiaA [Algoriphagus sp.]